MTTFRATKAFAIGTGGLVTSYAIGDVVQPAHAIIAPQFVGEEGAEAPADKAKAKAKTKAAQRAAGKKE